MAVTYEVSDRIATIVLDRQQALNSFDREQYCGVCRGLCPVQG